jgi:hypothetical protein
VAAADLVETLAVPLTPLMAALTVAEPCAFACTIPVLLTVATVESDEDQLTLAVTSLLLPSL